MLRLQGQVGAEQQQEPTPSSTLALPALTPLLLFAPSHLRRRLPVGGDSMTWTWLHDGACQ